MVITVIQNNMSKVFHMSLSEYPSYCHKQMTKREISFSVVRLHIRGQHLAYYGYSIDTEH